MSTRHTDQTREFEAPYSVKRSCGRAGFEAYHRRTCIGTASTEHEARVIAANHCFDAAAAEGGSYILVSLVEPTGMSPVTLVRVYRARLLKKKTKPHWATTRCVNVIIEMGATRDDGYELEHLASGQYYVCHGRRKWVLRDVNATTPTTPTSPTEEWEPGLDYTL